MTRRNIIIGTVISIIGLALIVYIYIFINDNLETIPRQYDGKMLIDGNIAAVVKMEEKGGVANFTIHLYKNAKPIDPNTAQISMHLKRFNDDIETIHFSPVDEYLKSQEEISEPHSFEVMINLVYEGKKSNWKYDNFENRIELSAEAIKSAGIKTQTAKSAEIQKKMPVIGKIVPNGDQMSYIYPRFGGLVKVMKKNLGEMVQKGEVIAFIESNESLREYPIISPIDGTIVQKNVIVGDMIKEDKAIYQIANLNSVWADLTLYRNEASLIKAGMPVVVMGNNGYPIETSTISYISPLGIEDSQTILARVVLPNEKQEWIPGMFVDASITYFQNEVPVSVLLSAVQRMGDENILFIQKGNIFEATPVELGQKNSDKVEIVSGLKVGQSYVSENSFILKAEIGKSEAGHEH